MVSTILSALPFFISESILAKRKHMKKTFDLKHHLALEQELLTRAAEKSITYRQQLQHRQVAPLPEGVAGLARFDEALPQNSDDPRRVIDMLDALGSPATMAMSGSRFFGFVIGASLPVTVAANWIAGAWDQNAGLFLGSPIAAKLEEVSLRWLLDILGLPSGSGGAFVTGAAVANFSCLAAARHRVLHDAGWDVETQGLFGAPPITVVIGSEAHPTLVKALGLLGLGRNRVITLPVDTQGRIDAGNLPDLSGPAIVCIQAGNVNTGAFDPALRIIPWARRQKAWLHVDGAFGLWAYASLQHRSLLEGFEAADSWATDAHKWLNVPYDSGLAFVRDAESLQRAMALSAAYLPVTEHREPSHYTPELSRRARGIEVWAALRTLGRDGIAEMIDRTCRLASRFGDGLSRAGFEILNDVVLNQVLVSFGDAERTNRVIAEIQREGTCWCGGTLWQGRTAMRISVSSWSTTESDVDLSLASMIRIAEKTSA
jgi:glutamate/tyrosine decarboxylase-like PLP-dependent enzyme